MKELVIAILERHIHDKMKEKEDIMMNAGPLCSGVYANQQMISLLEQIKIEVKRIPE